LNIRIEQLAISGDCVVSQSLRYEHWRQPEWNSFLRCRTRVVSVTRTLILRQRRLIVENSSLEYEHCRSEKCCHRVVSARSIVCLSGVTRATPNRTRQDEKSMSRESSWWRYQVPSSLAARTSAHSECDMFKNALFERAIESWKTPFIGMRAMNTACRRTAMSVTLPERARAEHP